MVPRDGRRVNPCWVPDGPGRQVRRQEHAGPVPHQFLVTFKNGFESVQAGSAPYLPGPLLRYTRRCGQVGAKSWQTSSLSHIPNWPCTPRGLRGPERDPVSMAGADDAGTVLTQYHHMLVAVIVFRDVYLPSTDLGPGPLTGEPLSPNSHIPELSSV